MINREKRARAPTTHTEQQSSQMLFVDVVVVSLLLVVRSFRTMVSVVYFFSLHLCVSYSTGIVVCGYVNLLLIHTYIEHSIKSIIGQCVWCTPIFAAAALRHRYALHRELFRLLTHRMPIRLWCIYIIIYT